MTIKRLIAIALVAALALRVVPILAPVFFPGYRRSVERLRRRADLATAAVMIALAASMFVRGEPVYGGVVAVLSIPAILAAIRVIRGR